MKYQVDRTVSGNLSRIFFTLERASRDKRLEMPDLNVVLDAAREIRGAMSIAQSIDNYLDAHRADSVINLVGKMAICQAIIEREATSNITSPDSSNIYNQFDFSRSENTWLNAFLRKVTEGIPREEIERVFANVAIVTFNYDRCIEQYLFYALQRYYRASEQDVISALSNLQIVHVYGKVGRLPWQRGASSAVPFGDLSKANLFDVASTISTFTEARYDSAVIDDIAAAFDNAVRIIFLGFSFQEQNVDVLPQVASHVDIFGTAQGMSNTNLKVIENKLPAHFKLVKQLVLDDIGAEAFIDNYWRVLE
ncbi:MAG: hypothetical protein BGO82_18880 [Devosia sp. 67-54]|uniref:SIR2 family protein n=2 Tax=unclassified Devosia TaxID=196773 RepID=UPI00095F1B9C|nr:SIR2 family protein [Devosia sp. 67-54]OJX18239.1 MAG: hypothetical protein BGO82_18880 [Devosia sp. 67-54]